MNKVECWPCEEAKQVIDLTGFSNFSSVYYYGGIPFLVKVSWELETSFSSTEGKGVFVLKLFFSRFPELQKARRALWREYTWRMKNYFPLLSWYQM